MCLTGGLARFAARIRRLQCWLSREARAHDPKIGLRRPSRKSPRSIFGLQAAFAGEDAALLNMERKTLRRTVARGDISGRQKGQGSKKPRLP